MSKPFGRGRRRGRGLLSPFVKDSDRQAFVFKPPFHGRGQEERVNLETHSSTHSALPRLGVVQAPLRESGKKLGGFELPSNFFPPASCPRRGVLIDLDKGNKSNNLELTPLPPTPASYVSIN